MIGGAPPNFANCAICTDSTNRKRDFIFREHTLLFHDNNNHRWYLCLAPTTYNSTKIRKHYITRQQKIFNYSRLIKNVVVVDSRNGLNAPSVIFRL